MRLRLCAGMVAATLLVPTYSMAAGSSIRTPLVSSAAAATPSPEVPPPKQLSTLGCGTHRRYDPKTQKCSGRQLRRPMSLAAFPGAARSSGRGPKFLKRNHSLFASPSQ